MRQSGHIEKIIYSTLLCPFMLDVSYCPVFLCESRYGLTVLIVLWDGALPSQLIRTDITLVRMH